MLGPRFVILSSLANISLKTRELADLHLELSITRSEFTCTIIVLLLESRLACGCKIFVSFLSMPWVVP